MPAVLHLRGNRTAACCLSYRAGGFNVINEELQQLTEKLSAEHFQKPFCHKAVFNHRLRTTGGRYMLQSHHIEINPKSYEYFGLEELIGIIKHELCHYHLHLEGKGYQHRDMDFKRLTARTGAPRFCRLIEDARRHPRYVHIYQCHSCREKVKRKRRFDTDKYVCRWCRGRFKKIKSVPL